MDAALAYLAALVFESDVGPDDLCTIVLAHGRQLLAARGDAFTGLLIKASKLEFQSNSFFTSFRYFHCLFIYKFAMPMSEYFALLLT